MAVELTTTGGWRAASDATVSGTPPTRADGHDQAQQGQPQPELRRRDAVPGRHRAGAPAALLARGDAHHLALAVVGLELTGRLTAAGDGASEAPGRALDEGAGIGGAFARLLDAALAQRALDGLARVRLAGARLHVAELAVGAGQLRARIIDALAGDAALVRPAIDTRAQVDARAVRAVPAGVAGHVQAGILGAGAAQAHLTRLALLAGRVAVHAHAG